MRNKQIIIGLVVLLVFSCGKTCMAQFESKLQRSFTKQHKIKASKSSPQIQTPSPPIQPLQNIGLRSNDSTPSPFGNQSESKLQRSLTEKWKIKASKPSPQIQTPSPPIQPLQNIGPYSYGWPHLPFGSYIYNSCIHQDCYHIDSKSYEYIPESNTYTQEQNIKETKPIHNKEKHDELEEGETIEVVLSHNIEVRAMSSYCSAIIATLEKGERIMINENELKKLENKTWLKLEAPEGWVHYDDFMSDDKGIYTRIIRLRKTTYIRSGPSKSHAVKQILSKDKTICFDEQELEEAIDELQPSMDNVDEIWLATIQPEGWISYKDYIRNHLR